uniref:ubiquitinyl hydrolase 1 n=1 Tax=Romanomermis culicivorax TaxID=13658 RepID=A0A915JJJ5_ROMCU
MLALDRSLKLILKKILASQRGLCGIINIGNTCFMNAALQILLNTEELRNYFLNKQFKKDLNVTNPLGCGGKLAIAFAYLCEQIWTSGDSFSDAAHVKEIIGTKSSQFSGFGQQDSQEFISFLLDGLHEDLNRVICKPTTSSVDTDGKSDFINAQMSWNTFLSRNDSIVVDLFYGQLRSHLVCPICEKVEYYITFDPFVFLPLSFPKPRIGITVDFWPADRDAFVRRVKSHFSRIITKSSDADKELSNLLKMANDHVIV